MKLKNSIITLTPTDKFILNVSRVTMHGRDLAAADAYLSQITDWHAFAVQVIKRGVAGFVVKKLPLLRNKSSIPDAIFLLIEQAYLRTINRSILLFGHFSTVVTALQHAEIEVIALKGVYLSEQLYPEIGLRQFSDIDVLIPANKALQAVDILLKLGYKYEESVPVSDYIRQKSDFVHLPPMILNGVSVELHVKLHQAGLKYNIQIDRVFATKISAHINGISVFALDEMHQLLHIALHAHKHFEEGNVNFNSFFDLANLLDSLPADFYWKSFDKLCSLYNAENIVYRYIILVQEFFEINVVSSEYLNKYTKVVREKHRAKFIMYLQGFKYTEPAKTAIPGHITNLRLLTSPKEKVKYLIDLFFPPKRFMLDKYKIKNEKLYLLYYPYRYLTIFSGLWHIISKKLKTTSPHLSP